MPHKQMLTTGHILTENRRFHILKETIDKININKLRYTSIKQIFY